MADSNEHRGKESSPEFSDDAIRRFLYGRLNAAEQAAFEEQLMVDDQLEGRVRRAECDLTDDYAFARLTDNDRELFERSFLVSKGRRQMLRTSGALRDRFATASDVTQTVSLRSQPDLKPGPWNRLMLGKRLPNLLGLNHPVRKYVLALLVLIMLIGTIWTVLRTPAIRNKIITKRLPTPAASPVSNQQHSHHPTKPAPPGEEETPLPPDPGPHTVQVLMPGNIYDPDRIPGISLPGSEQAHVRLQLAFKVNAQESYRAELMTAAGQSLYSTGSFKPAGGNGPIEFEVPSHFLGVGDYQVKLKRVTNDNEEVVATYYFRTQ